MRRYVSAVIPVIFFFLVTVSIAGASDSLIAKVYRDYPGYIESPVCENPRMKQPGAVRRAQDLGPADETVAKPSSARESLAPVEQPMVCDYVAGRFYFGGWLGAGVPLSSSPSFQLLDVDADYKIGYAAGLQLGYDLGPLRFDLDGSYRANDVDELKVNGTKAASIDGALEIKALMLNAYYDFESSSRVVPYLGAGIGIAEVSLDGFDANGIELVDGSDTVLAGQLAAGLRMPLSATTQLDVGYRFMMTDTAEFSSPAGRVEADVRSHVLLVGIQFKF